MWSFWRRNISGGGVYINLRLIVFIVVGIILVEEKGINKVDVMVWFLCLRFDFILHFNLLIL
jgi:hypothetical protein